MPEYVLTIGVPVYNGGIELRDTLESIRVLPQLGTLIQIVVSDNYSTDNSFLVASELLGGVEGVTLVQREENGGFRANLQTIYEYSKGTYLWFLGVGEKLNTNYIEEVLEILQSRQIDWGVCNGTFDDIESPGSKAPFLSKQFASASELSKIPVFSGSISLVFFHRTVAKNLATLSTDHKSNYFPHVQIIIDQLESDAFSENSWVYISTPLVQLRENAEGWWYHGPEAAEIFLEYLRVTISFRNMLPRSLWLKSRVRYFSGLHLLEFIFMLKITNANTRQIESLLDHPIKSPLRIVALAINAIPKPLLLAASKIKKRIHKQ